MQKDNDKMAGLKTICAFLDWSPTKFKRMLRCYPSMPVAKLEKGGWVASRKTLGDWMDQIIARKVRLRHRQMK